MKINNQIKEIEKGCGKIFINKKLKKEFICGCSYKRELQLCEKCKPQQKLLKQFQKEIKSNQEIFNHSVRTQMKEVQGELKMFIDRMPDGVQMWDDIKQHINQEQDKIFKNKFGENDKRK